ncbi:MAG: lamin tail domain-containing protein [Myxococcota bacterium]
MTSRWLWVWAVGCKSDPEGVDSGSPAVGIALFVNEVMPANVSTLADESGAFPDWVELYNPGDEAVEVGGLWITDDVADPMRHELSAELPPIEPGDYLVLFADDDEEAGPDHLSFGLAAAGGDDVALFAADGTVAIDTVLDLGPAVDDQSFARIPDGGELQRTSNPTPGAQNSP